MLNQAADEVGVIGLVRQHDGVRDVTIKEAIDDLSVIYRFRA
jgi:hypothetical protein